jgi:BMFP domain-containing protein YqiC
VSPPNRTASLQEKLSWAFGAAGRPSNRDLAKAMLGRTANKEEVEHLRTQISKWRNKVGVGVSEKNAVRLSRGFKALGLIVPDEFFMSADASRRGRDARLEEFERRLEELERRFGS